MFFMVQCYLWHLLLPDGPSFHIAILQLCRIAGHKMEQELTAAGFTSAADLRPLTRHQLVQRFGERTGAFLHAACRGKVVTACCTYPELTRLSSLSALMIAAFLFWHLAGPHPGAGAGPSQVCHCGRLVQDVPWLGGCPEGGVSGRFRGVVDCSHCVMNS